jgi:hypothetical protein
MNWIYRKNQEPDLKIKRILVCSSKTRNIHILHRDYDDWILSETDEDFPGETVEFDFWMHIPLLPTYNFGEQNESIKSI